MIGVVQHFVVRRGFGKIRGDNGQDYFAYWKNIIDNGGGKILVKNQYVEFDSEPATSGGKNPIAKNIKVTGMKTDNLSQEVNFGNSIQ